MSLVGLLALVAGCAGCAGGSGGDEGAATAGGTAAGEALSDSAGGGASAPAAPVQAALGSVPPAVIRTADLTVTVGEGRVDRAVERAADTADRLGGFVLETTSSGRGDRVSRVVLRVPAAAFNDALGELRRLGDVARASIRGEDVSLELVDLGARLENVQAQRTSLRRLLDRARTVADTIRVQRVLADVQLQAEQAAARLRYLRDRASLATITVELREGEAAEPGEPARLAQAFDDAVDAAAAVVAAAIVAVGFVLPLAILALAALAGFVLARRALRRRAPPALSLDE
jgi:hypothetical protein